MIAIRHWPRGWRLTLYWVTMMITLLILVPAFVVAGAYLLGFGACDSLDTAGASQICSPLGRLLLGAVIVAGGFLFFLPWTRFLQRTMAVDSKIQPSRRISSTFPAAVVGTTMDLPLGQKLVAGRIQSCSQSSRTILFNGAALTLMSLYPLQKGWLKQGDQMVVVYQRTPLGRNLRFVLAFWGGSPNPVRGVAAISQSLSIFIAAACIVIFTTVPAPLPGLWITVCSFGVILSSLYLTLMLRAKAILSRFIAGSAS